MAEHVHAEAAEARPGDAGTGVRRLAGIYAEALLNAAEKRGQGEVVGKELDALADELFKADSRTSQFFGSPIIKRSTKEPLLAKAFEGKVSDLLFSFLGVLNGKDRLGLIPHVATAYRELVDRRAKRVRVLVRTAVALEDGQREALAETMRKGLGKDPVLDVKVDPSLLGGLVVRVGDEVFDASVSTQIETIRRQLLANSSHEIQVGRERFIEFRDP